MAGFATTAAYFEALADKTRGDDDRRKLLLEVAGFYHSLAKVVPGIPAGQKLDGKESPSRVLPADRWRARAEECRTLADCFTDEDTQRQLRALADGYDRMVEAAEQTRR